MHDNPLLLLCQDLNDAGVWLALSKTGALMAGPASLAKTRPDLMGQLKDHKAAILTLLDDCLAHSLFGKEDTDPRFETEVCPDCQQPVYIVLAPRRLGVHRLPGGKGVCPGSDRAQRLAVDTLMPAFIADCCLEMRLGQTTWIGVRGALEAWAIRRGMLLPPRPYVIAWLDAHFPQHGDETLPRWQGFVLQAKEWLGEDEETPPTPVAKAPEKFMLKA